MAKRFILMTYGRTGSTSLMRALAEQVTDIGLPGALLSNCEDEELLHENRRKEHAASLRKLMGEDSASGMRLHSMFFQLTDDYKFAGYKSMPYRHRGYSKLIEDQHLQIITLNRKDTASVIASFMIAESTGSWRRDGGNQLAKWTFNESNQDEVDRLQDYVLRMDAKLNEAKKAIRLTYEDLCKNDFCSDELNDFFGVKIRLAEPKPPVSGEDYTENWQEFTDYLAKKKAELVRTPAEPESS